MDDGSIYDMVRRRTTEALGFPVNLHQFRLAAGNLWSIADPSNMRGVKDPLGQIRYATTEKHYIGAVPLRAGACKGTSAFKHSMNLGCKSDQFELVVGTLAFQGKHVDYV